jgi:hypothetical protein
VNNSQPIYSQLEQRSVSFVHLQSANLELQNLVTSLTGTLLRNAALLSVDRDAANGMLAETFVSAADECIRCARLPGIREEIALGLEAAAREYMARAVQIETENQKERRKK